MAQLRAHRNLYGAVPMEQQMRSTALRRPGAAAAGGSYRISVERRETKAPVSTGQQRAASAPVQTQTKLSFGMILLALTAVVVLLVVLITNLSLWSRSSHNQHQINALRRSIADIEQTNAMLEDDIKYAVDGDKICNYAVNRLGMRPQSESQTRYISLEGVVGNSP